MAKVSTIPAIIQRKKVLKVAAYARVSTGKLTSIDSLSAQVDYYSKLINSNPEWTLAGLYIDEAKTGTKECRKNYIRLINDCRAGKIDMVLTKTVSRFSRNTITLLSTCRELKSLGIDVYFEAQHIHTISNEGELMLTLLASLAQDEARSDSENMKWRIRRNFEEGKPWNIVIYGYRFKDGKFVIEPDEARVVKEIFSLYLDGFGYSLIARKLNEQGALPMYNETWSASSVRHILTHYIYTGNLLLQRYYNENFITKKTIQNKGELPMYHAEETHEAIISKETWERVQAEMEQRTEQSGATHNSKNHYPFTSRIVCDCCGKNYRRKMKHGQPFWICSIYNSKGKRFCPESKAVPEDTLIDITNSVLNTDCFDEELFADRIKSITVYPGNKLLFRFENNTTVERIWKDKSRADSWTPQMKEQARIASLRRNELCRR